MTAFSDFDAIIIGGGPAGSSAARTLSLAGLSVLVLDKSPFPRDKVCAGWITPQVVELADINLEEYIQGRTLQPINRFRTGMLGSTMLTTEYDNTVSYGILRREFDHYLLQQSGAELRLGETLRDIQHSKGEWLLNGTLRTPLLIGAGGHACPVARMLNPGKKGMGDVVVAQEVEFPLSERQSAVCAVKGDRPELYFLPELDGYGWCFRKGDYLNIGLGRTDNRRLGEYVDKFRHYLAERGRIPADLPAPFRGHAYRLATGYSARNIINDGVMLAGDAVGLAYAQSGEGIRTAIESGIMAAETAVKADGDYRQARLGNYPKALAQRYDEGKVGWPLPEGIKYFFARKILSNHMLTRHIVLNKWFLRPG